METPMSRRLPVCHPDAKDAAIKTHARKLIRRAHDLLKEPNDTFLGRRTFEPFPPEDSAANATAALTRRKARSLKRDSSGR